MLAMISDAKLRKIRSGSRHFLHRTPNGFNDPYTNFHIAETLLAGRTEQKFTAAQLAKYMNETVPGILWDSVTVGRVLNAMMENWEEANGKGPQNPIVKNRFWDGVYYEISRDHEARVAMLRLVEDLIKVCEGLAKEEAKGIMPRRIDSPLLLCPSIMDPLRAA